jgi:hypothetical protein
MLRRTLPALVIGYTFLVMVPEAKGANGYEQCNQILTQDIFNKVMLSKLGIKFVLLN